MSEKLAFCLFLISVEGSIEDQLKVGGRRRRRRRRRRRVVVSLGHGSCQEGEKKLVDGKGTAASDGDQYGTTDAGRRSQWRSHCRRRHFHILPTAPSPNSNCSSLLSASNIHPSQQCHEIISHRPSSPNVVIFLAQPHTVSRATWAETNAAAFDCSTVSQV